MITVLLQIINPLSANNLRYNELGYSGNVKQNVACTACFLTQRMVVTLGTICVKFLGDFLSKYISFPYGTRFWEI